MSVCCHKAIVVRWSGWPQFAREGTTHWFVCTGCWEPTDRMLKAEPDSDDAGREHQ